MYPNTLFLAKLHSLTGAPVTVRGLALRLDVAPSKVSGWNVGTLHPTMAVFAKIRAALGQRAVIKLFRAALTDAEVDQGAKRLEVLTKERAGTAHEARPLQGKRGT